MRIKIKMKLMNKIKRKCNRKRINKFPIQIILRKYAIRKILVTLLSYSIKIKSSCFYR